MTEEIIWDLMFKVEKNKQLLLRVQIPLPLPIALRRGWIIVHTEVRDGDVLIDGTTGTEVITNNYNCASPWRFKNESLVQYRDGRFSRAN